MLEQSLLTAAKQNRFREIPSLIAQKADVNTCDRDGYTALHWAAVYGNDKAADLLIAHKASLDVRTKDAQAYTPLNFAAYNKCNGVVGILLENGASPFIVDGARELMPSSWAARTGNYDEARMIIESVPHASRRSEMINQIIEDKDCKAANKAKITSLEKPMHAGASFKKAKARIKEIGDKELLSAAQECIRITKVCKFPLQSLAGVPTAVTTIIFTLACGLDAQAVEAVFTNGAFHPAAKVSEGKRQK